MGLRQGKPGSTGLMGGWTGKIIGALAGFLLGRVVGALIGLVIGHQFDRGLRAGRADRSLGGLGRGNDNVQVLFFTTTFSVMGHVAKADGRVSEEEIQAARGIMYHMRLSPEQVREAIARFTQGKSPGFPLRSALEEFRRGIGFRRELIMAFVEIQVQAAAADGRISGAQRNLLWEICQQLEVSRVELAQIEALVFAQRHGRRAAQDSSTGLRQAYRVLGVTPGATDKEVKTAYRRLMNQHHPDKLIARGVPEEMLRDSKEKIREIRAAYDSIKAVRKLR